ncbi:hypothetical protein C882_0446 [Caenispirillum salinarum AK4]|uniref:DUF218 domain-containing protein n=1 Tax=Caenispirillum salinarum AK4 TaxID=1238182 RepID=K9GWM8_9PROT|nr:YdcF family protein [Caenispirillum salinarum]EKV29139.1 hypothetical protein C882_0446 [Caenispirillum salinarum AK4]
MSMTDAPPNRVSLGDFPTADVIVVLGAAVRPDGTPSAALLRRADHAGALWRAGRAPVVLASGGQASGPADAPTEAHLIAMHLTADHGLPPTAVLREDAARNTLENAAFCLTEMKRRGWRCALVVTDGPHMPRALWCFRTLARRRRLAVTLVPAPAPAPGRFGPGWWAAVAWEAAALPVYAWRLWRAGGG